MVDLDRVRHRLELLAGYRRELRRLSALPPQVYRNRLVHVCDDIDDVLVHRLLSAALPDLDAFAAAVARVLST